MRGISRNIAIVLALSTLAVTGVARTAEAKGTGSAVAAAAVKLSRGAQIRVNRMKQKLSLRPRGALQQKTRRQLRLSKRNLQRAMGRREIGLRTSETDRVRQRFARDIDDPADHGPAPTGSSHDETDDDFKTPDVPPDYLEQSSGAKQGKRMRERARKETTPPKKKIPKRRRSDD